MPFPQITDVPLTDAQRQVAARCVHIVRQDMASGYAFLDDGNGLLRELDELEATFLGPDLKLPVEPDITDGLAA